ncbi:amnionless-like protein [Dermatophagoides farinae]|uniref:Protein amnionless n=1 Tax=Dermatophagoides farinae TaxID=6954 RepID=A0A9D4SKF7_DERFA|nr:amnionless-like protein [Dermatophagoides farinae]
MILSTILLLSTISILSTLIEPVNLAGYSSMDLQPLIVRQRRLIWRKQLHFDDVKNWQPNQRFPCYKDRVVLPENYAVFLNQRLVVTELILPENGELIISKDGEYRQTNSWFNPDNWHVTFVSDSTMNNPPITTTTTGGYRQISTYATFHYQQTDIGRMIIPDSERIPCHQDFVDFPTNGTWKVQIGQKSHLIPSLGRLMIGTQFPLFQTEKLQKFFQSFIGQMLFTIQDYNHMEIESSTNECRNADECHCGNDQPKIMQEICKYRNCPKQLKCHDPIQAPGFCCPICATSILIRLKKQRKNSGNSPNTEWFVYRTIGRHLDKLYQRKESLTDIKKNVNLYIHWLYDNSIHVIISPMLVGKKQRRTNPLIDSDENGRKLLEKLSNDELLSKLTKITYRSSRDWIQDSQLFNSFILAIFMLILLIGFFGFLAIYNYIQRNRMDPAFTFVRFRSAASDVEMELDNPGLSDCPNGSSSSPPLPSSSLSARNFPNFRNIIQKMTTDIVTWTTRQQQQQQQQQPRSMRLRNDNDEQQREFENPVFKLTATTTTTTVE